MVQGSGVLTDCDQAAQSTEQRIGEGGGREGVRPGVVGPEGGRSRVDHAELGLQFVHRLRVGADLERDGAVRDLDGVNVVGAQLRARFATG